MWVLILTLTMYSGFPDGGVSVHMHSVDGFRTQDGCKVAGRLWLDKAPSSNSRKTAICVSKDK